MLRKDGSDTDTGRHGDKCRTAYRPDPPGLSIVRVEAASVPYGTDISRNGKSCWAAYLDGVLIGVAATADGARRKYREWRARPREQRNGGENVDHE